MSMIPAGYMYKSVVTKPDWLESDRVEAIYSLSGCVSEDFCDWIGHWKHNGYWLFDSPEVMEALAAANGIDLAGMTLFFYRFYHRQWNELTGSWEGFQPEASLPTQVKLPERAVAAGYDVTSFSAQNAAECSPLSCNRMAQEIPVNSHCLLSSVEVAKRLIESGTFAHCEPGPYRIVEVCRVEKI
ncbi:hypothetical protein [Motiliproteus sp.]|uniref:hypothetical protein n=1 Tax=Motiliproteus sp. TaxID=1898955 RepID=UPI003BAD7911